MSNEQSRLKTTDRMSNTGYHANGKPTWWARVGSEFIKVAYTRGDSYLDCVVDIPPGTEVFCGAGKGTHKTVRQTVITTAMESPAAG